jgi:hypothetical protein
MANRAIYITAAVVIAAALAAWVVAAPHLAPLCPEWIAKPLVPWVERENEERIRRGIEREVEMEKGHHGLTP